MISVPGSALMKYCHTVRLINMTFGFPAARFYDDNFRWIGRGPMMSCGACVWPWTVAPLRPQCHNPGPVLILSVANKVAGPLSTAGSTSDRVRTTTNPVVLNMSAQHAPGRILLRTALEPPAGQLLPTPNLHKKLDTLLEGYDPARRKYLVRGFCEGFQLGVIGPVQYWKDRNQTSALQLSQVVSEKNRTEAEVGRYVGPMTFKHLPQFMSFPLDLVPKWEPNTYRLIHDLSLPEVGSVDSAISSVHNLIYQTCSCFISYSD